MLFVNFEKEKNLLPSVARSEHKIKVLRSVHAERVLIFSPHPDDDVFGMGGLIGHLVSKKARVRTIFVTDGARGNKSLGRSGELIGEREEEAVLSARVLGAIEVKFWRMQDCELKNDEELFENTMGEIKSYKPDLILVPSKKDWHPDHRTVFEAVYKSVKKIKVKKERPKLWQYGVWGIEDINLVMPIDEYVNLKREAISCHRSQLRIKRYDEAILGLNEYFGKGLGVSNYAEAFLEEE